MSRQINLFNPALIKRQDHVNARLLLAMSVGVLLLTLCSFIYARYQLAALVQEHDQVSAQLKNSQMQLVQLARAPRQPSRTLQEATVALDAKLEMHRQLLTYLQQDKFGSHEGFSSTMRAFARKSIDALWLTGFSIDHDSREMTLYGRALQPDLVAQYIAQLGMDPAFHGRSFSAFSLGVPKAQAAAKPSDANAAASAAPVPFIEFELKSVQQPEDKLPLEGHKS